MIFRLGILDEISEMLQQLKETFSNAMKLLFEEFQESPQKAVQSKGLF